MKINKKLLTLYPTKEVLQKHRDKYKSWKNMSEGTGIPIDALKEHRKVLGMDIGREGGWGEKYNDLSFDEIVKNIGEMIGDNSKNVYDKYMIVDDKFYENPTGYDHLKFIGVFAGTSFTSRNLPSAIMRGGRRE